MSDHLKGQHLGFAGGETLSRNSSKAPQWKSTSLSYKLNHHQHNKPGLQILSPKPLQVNQSFKGHFIFKQSPDAIVCECWNTGRDQSRLDFQMLQNSMYIPGMRRWNSGASEENKLCRPTWGNSHIFLFSENPLKASKVSSTASVTHRGWQGTVGHSRIRTSISCPTTANIEIMSFGKTLNL